jgi:hypothetical protein
MNYLWPKKLATPNIELGIPVKQGLEILSSFGEPVEERDEEEHSYRVDTSGFSLAIYNADGVVKGVWFDDPLGRIWARGKAMKINLYLARYGKPEDWELRLNDEWMHHHYNENADVIMVYGVHNDVIRFNMR